MSLDEMPRTEMRHPSRGQTSCWNFRIFLQTMEGEFLSGEASRPRDASLLFEAVLNRRNQSQLLSHAHRDVAFEVRHPSWYTDETYAVLRQHNTALCLSETEKQTPPDVLTADFTYARLRLEDYTAKQLAAWRKRFDAWLALGVDVYAYCKHEDAGKGPGYARQLLGL